MGDAATGACCVLSYWSVRPRPDPRTRCGRYPRSAREARDASSSWTPGPSQRMPLTVTLSIPPARRVTAILSPMRAFAPSRRTAHLPSRSLVHRAGKASLPPFAAHFADRRNEGTSQTPAERMGSLRHVTSQGPRPRSHDPAGARLGGAPAHLLEPRPIASFKNRGPSSSSAPSGASARIAGVKPAFETTR